MSPNEMPDTKFPVFNCLMKGQDTRYTWNDLLGELLSVITLSGEEEKYLLDIIQFKGRLRLIANSEMPHSMSPENMLKSLAVQALGKYTGFKYLKEMKKLQETCESSESFSLRSMIQSVIEKTSVSSDILEWSNGEPKTPGWYLLEFSGGDRFAVVRVFIDDGDTFRMEEQQLFGYIADLGNVIVRHLRIPPVPEGK